MAETILGIDVEDGRIRLVRTVTTFKGAQVDGFATAELPPGADLSSTAEAVRDLMDSRGLAADRYVLGVAGLGALLRHLVFPFSSEAKILQVLEFELESTLPVDIDTVCMDFLKTSRNQEGGQGVLAAALPKEIINPLLDAFQRAGIDPDLIDLDLSGLTGIARELRELLPARAAFLEIGWTRSLFLYQSDGRPAAMRALATGIRDLAGAAAKLPLFDLSPRSLPRREEEQAVAACRAVISRIAREVRVTLMAALDGAAQGPELLVLCGEGAGLKGVASLLGAELGLPVRRLGEFEAAPLFARLASTDEVAGVAPVAVAMGLAARAASRAPGFNFRSGEFSSHKSMLEFRGNLLYLGAAILAVFLAWAGAAAMDIHAKGATLANLQERVGETFQAIEPELAKTPVQPTQYVGLLKNKIGELTASMAFLSSDPDQPLLVDVLKSISAAVPRELDLGVSQFTLDGKVVRMGGVADSFNTVEDVKNRLTATGRFAEVKILSANAGAAGKGVSFTLEMVRKAGKEAQK